MLAMINNSRECLDEQWINLITSFFNKFIAVRSSLSEGKEQKRGFDDVWIGSAACLIIVYYYVQSAKIAALIVTLSLPHRLRHGWLAG